jgi:hypothetical protein
MLPDLRPVLSTDMKTSQMDEKGIEKPSPQEFENRKSSVQHYTRLGSEVFKRDEHVPTVSCYVKIKAKSCLSPQQDSIESKIKKLDEEISKALPGFEHFYNACYDPKMVSAGCFTSKYDLGGIEVRQGLDSTYAMVAARSASASNVEEVDLFVVAKLLPFHRKLFLFNQKPADKVIYGALLSDLVDELKVMHGHTQKYGKMEKSKMEAAMCSLQQFLHHDFSLVCQTSNGSDTLKDLLVKYRSAACFSRTSLMSKGNRLLKDYIRGVCMTMMSKYFQSIDKKAYQNLRKGLDTAKLSAAERLNAFIDPLKLSSQRTVSFNHWVSQGVTNIISSDIVKNDFNSSNSITDNFYESQSNTQRPIAAQRFVTRCNFPKPPTLYPNTNGTTEPEPSHGRNNEAQLIYLNVKAPSGPVQGKRRDIVVNHQSQMPPISWI